MPQAVTHILIPIIILSLFRDMVFKGKKREKFPLHYVLIGGLAGLIPDLDVAAYYVLSFFGFTLNEIHRTFSHNIFVVLIFVILGLIFMYSGFKNKGLGRHHLKLHNIFFVISFGFFVHLLLDYLVAGQIMPLYPFIRVGIGLNLISIFPDAWQDSIIPSIDAILLMLWLVYLELKHKISDFI